MATYSWTGNLYNWCGGKSYGSFGACHMWRTLLGEGGIYFGWHHDGRKSYGDNIILECTGLTLEDTME